MSEEELRELLLAEVYAGAFSGLGAMLLDEDRIRNAGAEELEELARDLYGIYKGDMLYFPYNKIPHASGRMRKSELQRKNY